MTTQTTTMQPSTKGVRAFIGATAATLAVLGGALLWQVRPTSETAAPATTTMVSTMNDGVAPLGGLAEQYHEQQQTAAAVAAARVTTTGGMAEFYAAQAPVATTAAVTTMGGMAERYREQQAAARTAAAQLEHMGGMAELYREQGQRASSAP